MDFLILRPLSPKTGYHFFEGGVGGGGGSKVFAEKAPSNGRHLYVTFTLGRMVTHPTADFLVGGSNPGVGPPAATPLLCWPYQGLNRRGCLHYHSATADSETTCSPHCWEPCLPLTKKPKCVFLSD